MLTLEQYTELQYPVVDNFDYYDEFGYDAYLNMKYARNLLGETDKWYWYILKQLPDQVGKPLIKFNERVIVPNGKCPQKGEICVLSDVNQFGALILGLSTNRRPLAYIESDDVYELTGHVFTTEEDLIERNMKSNVEVVANTVTTFMEIDGEPYRVRKAHFKDHYAMYWGDDHYDYSNFHMEIRPHRVNRRNRVVGVLHARYRDLVLTADNVGQMSIKPLVVDEDHYLI